MVIWPTEICCFGQEWRSLPPFNYHQPSGKCQHHWNIASITFPSWTRYKLDIYIYILYMIYKSYNYITLYIESMCVYIYIYVHIYKQNRFAHILPPTSVFCTSGSGPHLARQDGNDPGPAEALQARYGWRLPVIHGDPNPKFWEPLVMWIYRSTRPGK